MSHFGKYRGTVATNVDPMMQGRIQVNVPSVLGAGQLSWALPNAPYAGDGVGFFVMPPVGANVWVEFEGGDTDHPIWAGCFWSSGEVPAPDALPTTQILKTESVTLKLSDLPGASVELSPARIAALEARVADLEAAQSTAAEKPRRWWWQR